MSPNLPLVSVVIPLYNHQKYVEAALKSVFNQTYPRLEVIVVDDGSEDESAAVVRGQLHCSPYPLHIKRQANQGAHAAINNGIELATGQTIAILNSDDCFHEQRIERMVRSMDEEGGRFAYSGVEHIGEEGQPVLKDNPYRYHYRKSLHKAGYFPTLSFELIRHNFAISTGNFLFTRDLFEEVGPFQDYETCHDWDYLLRVILLEEPVFVEEALYQYRLHSDNTLQQREQVRKREIGKVMKGYLQHMDEAQNPLAPTPAAWGPYWSYFVGRYMNHFQGYDEVRELLGPRGQDRYPRCDGIRGRMVEICYRALFRALRLWERTAGPTEGAAVDRWVSWVRGWTRFLSALFPA